MKILIFGCTGQVGSALQPPLRALGEVVALDQLNLDLRDLDGAQRVIVDQRPQVVVNAAAYTAVDQAENDAEAAYVINAEVPGAMAAAAKRIQALFVHYSTDYVFSGSGERPYTEEMEPGPVNVYGHTKLAGERAVKEVGGDYLIFRTSWVYSRHGRNFLNTMLRLAEEREELQVVNDQFGAPTYAGAIAEATAIIVARVCDGSRGKYAGVYHMTCGGTTTWYEFAKAIFACAGKNAVTVIPVSTAAYPTPARRPRYSVLDNRKLREHFQIALPPWREALKRCLADTHSGDEC